MWMCGGSDSGTGQNCKPGWAGRGWTKELGSHWRWESIERALRGRVTQPDLHLGKITLALVLSMNWRIADRRQEGIRKLRN